MTREGRTPLAQESRRGARGRPPPSVCRELLVAPAGVHRIRWEGNSLTEVLTGEALAFIRAISKWPLLATEKIG